MKHLLGLKILVLLLFYSCGEQENVFLNYNDEQKIINDCLLAYGDCSGVIDQMNFPNDPVTIFLKAKWASRNSFYSKADSLYKLIEPQFSKMPTNSDIYQDFVLSDIYNKFLLSEYDIETENKLLQRINDENYFKVKLLLEKSSKLRESNNINHSFTTVLYAFFLIKKWNLETKGRYQAEYFHAVNLYRESINDQAQYFINIASENCSDLRNPACRKIKCLAITFAADWGQKIIVDQNIYSLLLSHGQYTPSIDEFIRMQFNVTAYNVTEVIKKSITQLESSKKNCTKNFNRTIYLIDDLLYVGELELADKYLEYLRICKIIDKKKEYLYLYRDQNYHLAKYKQTCEEKYLLRAFEISCNTIEISLKNFGAEENTHLADFIYENNATIIESIYALLQIQSVSLTNDEIIRQLIEGKEMFDRISNASVVFEGKDVPEETMALYSTIRNEIDALEQQINEYRDTIFKDLSIYEDIYFLYEELYEMEVEIDSMPINSVVKKEVPFSSIKEHLLASNSQAIDIVATEQYYYFSFLRPDTIIVTQYERDEIDQSIALSLAQINNEKGNPNDHYDNQRLLALMQPYLDTSLHNIIIIPDLQFIQYPFEQLIVSSPKESFVSYLGDYYNISYQYNVSKITDEESRTSFIDSDISIYSFTNDLTMNNKHKLEDFEQIELEYGLKEAEGILNLYEFADTIFGEELTKNNIYKTLSSSILHFSTHSASNLENLLDNYLFIRDQEGITDKMYGFEIKNKVLNNSLVILSSCNSGTGTYKPGAGTFSLSRDFLQAGAQTVIKSLWSVYEISTAQLMIYFHENFQAGYTASMSLTLAKRKLKQDPQFAHPFYWAGFVLEGNPAIRLKTE